MSWCVGLVWRGHIGDGGHFYILTLMLYFFLIITPGLTNMITWSSVRFRLRSFVSQHSPGCLSSCEECSRRTQDIVVHLWVAWAYFTYWTRHSDTRTHARTHIHTCARRRTSIHSHSGSSRYSTDISLEITSAGQRDVHILLIIFKIEIRQRQ